MQYSNDTDPGEIAQLFRGFDHGDGRIVPNGCITKNVSGYPIRLTSTTCSCGTDLCNGPANSAQQHSVNVLYNTFIILNIFKIFDVILK